MLHCKKYSISKKQCIETGLVMILIALITGMLAERQIFQFFSVILVLAILLFPMVLYPFAFVWFGFSRLLGALTSRILLYLIFFLIVTPVAIIRRLAGEDRLGLKDFKKGKTTAFVMRSHKYIPEDMARTY